MIRISMIWLKYHMSSIWTIMLMIATWLFENCTWEKRGINWNNSHNNHQKKKKIEYYFNWSDIPLMRTWATAIGYRKRGVMLVETILGARGNTPRKVAGVFYHPPDNNVDRIIFFEHSYGNFRNLFFFFCFNDAYSVSDCNLLPNGLRRVGDYFRNYNKNANNYIRLKI